MHERIGIFVIARIGHATGDVELHLLLVIKRRPELRAPGGFGADLFHEIFQPGTQRLLFRRQLAPFGIRNRQRGAGADHRHAAAKQMAAQKLGGIDRGRI